MGLGFIHLSVASVGVCGGSRRSACKGFVGYGNVNGSRGRSRLCLSGSSFGNWERPEDQVLGEDGDSAADEEEDLTRNRNERARDIIRLLKSGKNDLALEAFRKSRLKDDFLDGDLVRLVQEFCRKSSPQVAEAVLREFETETERTADISAYNALMKGYSKARMVQAIDDIIYGMLNGSNSEVKPDIISFGILIDTYAKLNKMPAAESVLRTMMSMETVQPDVHIFTSLIRGYATANRFEEVKRCFSRLHDANLKPDLVLYNVAIGAAKRARNVSAAETIFERMKEDGIHPDVFTFTAFIQLYANDREFGLAKEAFERIREHGIEPDQHAYCAMIVACNRAGEFDEAEGLFREMKVLRIPPDLAIYNTMISIRSRIGEEVESLMEEMHGSSIRSDHVTDWIIANKKRKRGTGGTFAGLEKEPSSLLEITQAMRELGKAGDVEQVLRLFRKAKQMGSDVAVYNAAVQALIVARRHTAAKHVLGDMRNQLIKFDVATFSMCMVLLARDPNTKRETPYRLLQEMDVEGVFADTAIFNTMLRIKSIRPDDVLREMQMRKLQPDNYTKRALIAVYLRKRQPIRALRTLQKTEDWDARSVNQVIHSLRQHGEKDLADKLSRYSLERGVDLDS
ncbi:hypothetical protein NDN08_003199 [Rhodosorus marinus]|uniref:Pentacotripeptide-repeat region of PRORP domain-containing protein n=1 Tax=Rhodosorus marinus TaxID=101924 RepID=A0AAV8UVU8_9RHOD|nr:hypothetical protein NDN08_003199 [Rhodosorus marinus]